MTTRPSFRRLGFAALAALAMQAMPAAAQSTATRPVELFVTLPVKPGAMDGFLATMRENVKGSRAEDGNISFDAYRHEEGGNELFLVERWDDQAAYDSHERTSHAEAINARARTDLEQPPIQTRLVRLSPEAGMKPIPNPAVTRNLVVTLHLKPEARDSFTKALLDVVAPSRAASGNLAFDVYRASDDGNTLVIVERWTDVASHEAHLKQPYNEPLGAIFEASLSKPLGDGRRLLVDVSDG